MMGKENQLSLSFATTVATKRCRACRQHRPLSQFYREKHGRLGVRGTCKQCDAARHAVQRAGTTAQRRETHRAWCDRNPEKVRAGNARYHAAHREQQIERSRQWYLAHPEQAYVNARAWRERNRAKADAQRRAWVAAHPERVAALRAAWKIANIEKVRAYGRAASARRRARLAAVCDLTRDQLAEVFDVCGWICSYCLRPAARLEIEHVTPLVLGGHHTQANLVTACRSCNARKSDRGPLSMLNRCASAAR